MFGAQAWKDYFGVEIDSEPEPPSNIEEILNKTAPFKLDNERCSQRVRDNHFGVLIPSQVNREAFSLNKLGALSKHYFPNNRNEKGYSYYVRDVHEHFGDASPDRSYWVLIARHILEGSRNKPYSAQEALVGKYSRHGYGLPIGLEAASAQVILKALVHMRSFYLVLQISDVFFFDQRQMDQQ